MTPEKRESIQADLSELIAVAKGMLSDLDCAESCEKPSDLLDNLRSARGNALLIAQELAKTIKAAEKAIAKSGSKKNIAIEALLEKGAQHLKQENSHGETKSGWWLDQTFLAPYNMPELALQVIEG